MQASQHPWIVHRWGWIPNIAIGEALESSTNFHIAAVLALLGLWFAPTERKKCGLKLCTWARGGRMHGCELAGGGHQNRGLCLVLVLWSQAKGFTVGVCGGGCWLGRLGGLKARGWAFGPGLANR